MTRTVESTLNHRPFATLLRPSAGDTAIAAGTVWAEISALVRRGALHRRDGDDLLARLGLQVLPYRWAVAVRVPVTVTITAPNDRYATQAGIGQLIAALGRLRCGYLTQPGTITAPTDHPAHHSLRALTCRRTDAFPGYPVGGIYQIGADALLAIMVNADHANAAHAVATARLATELSRLTGIDVDPKRMRHLGTRRFTGLDDPPDSSPGNTRDPDATATGGRADRGEQP